MGSPMPEKNRPLLLRPVGKDYLWGGSRLNDDFEKNIPLAPLAETWETGRVLCQAATLMGKPWRRC